MARAPLDLSQLALDRPPAGEKETNTPRRRPWLSRYVLPFGILVGFLIMLGVTAGNRLLPQREVTVVPVVVKRAEAQQAGTPLFQSPGWIEPRPTAVSVAALAPGVIEDLLVVAGQQVKKGEPIARLISIDAELDVEQAQALLAIREGELNRAKAERNAARIRKSQPIHLQVPLADAQSMLARVRTELDKLPFEIEAAAARLEYALGNMRGKQSARGAISERVIELSASEHIAAAASLRELQNQQPNLQREADALSSKVNALRNQLELLVEETRQLAEAEAKVESSTALRDEAKLRLRRAELALERNTIRAPIDGRILRLVAAPGMRVMGLEASAGQSSGTVVEMYNPRQLQVRADVRLEDVPRVSQGQAVEIETASSTGVIQGRVLLMTSSANVQKNTLEVKVELIDPPPTASPEMLVKATFLAPPAADEESNGQESQRLFVPNQLIRTGDSGPVVWTVDSDDRAQLRSVQVGRPSGDGLMEVKTGLNVTDKLIASDVRNLTPGGRVAVIGDDPTLGMK